MENQRQMGGGSAPPGTRWNSSRRDLIHDDERRSDLFEWSALRQTLRETIDCLPTPGCVALYGPWGAGKTTTLQHVQAELDEEQLHVTAWFDPWEYERSTDVARLLLQSILVALAAKGELKDDWRKKAARLLSRLGRVTLKSTVAALRLFGLPAPELPEAIGELSAADLFEKEKAALDDVQAVKQEFSELVEEALGSIPEIAGQQRRLVVFLDDLDRCLPHTALSVLEATKLLLCGQLPKKNGRRAPALFVFALDRQLVGEAIATHYQSRAGYTGESYLEKIFDVSIEVPPATTEKMKDLLVGLAEFKSLAPTQDQQGFVVEALSRPVFCNPRVLMRTVNRLTLMTRGAARRKGQWPVTEHDWRRLIWWVAGAERFRSFRLAFAGATRAEIQQLHEALMGQGAGSVELTPSVRALLSTPRLGEFYELVFAGLTSEQVHQERSLAGAAHGMTIGAFEALLRPLGI